MATFRMKVQTKEGHKFLFVGIHSITAEAKKFAYDTMKRLGLDEKDIVSQRIQKK